MTNQIIIIALILALIYLYYQNRKLKQLPATAETIFDYNSDSDDETPFPSRQKLQFELTQKTEQITSLQKQIERLKEGKDIPEDYQELETERDEAIREQKTLEQENISLSNKLKLKNQEVNSKDKEIQRLVKEKSDKEIALNRTITGKNKELEELKKKYSKQGKLLDEEQTDNNKLTNKIEELEQQIQELSNRSNSPMPGEFPEDQREEFHSARSYESDETTSTSLTSSVKHSLNDFIDWIEAEETRESAFQGVDWNFYQNKKNWMNSFTKWNALRTDRLELLKEWKEEEAKKK